MEQDNWLRIQGNYMGIVKDLDVSHIVDHLIQNGILSDEEQEMVSSSEMRITRQEAVRRLLKIIKRKTKGFSVFCDALNEFGYEHLRLEILTTDPSNVASADETDAQGTGKIKKFESQLLATTKYMLQFKEEIENLKSKCNEQSIETNEIKAKFQDLEKTMEAKGLTQSQVIKYLEDYVVKREHPNREAIECPDGSSVDGSMKLKRLSMGNPSSLTDAIARHLGVDVVQFMAAGKANAKPASNKYAAVMREFVIRLSDLHPDVFERHVNTLEIDQINGFETLSHVADTIFLNGESNWGRIVALYTFGGHIAKKSNDTDERLSEMIGDFLGYYVSTNLSEWIESNGGWEGFVDFFEDKKRRHETNETLQKAVVYSIIGALGVAVVGTVVAVRKS